MCAPCVSLSEQDVLSIPFNIENINFNNTNTKHLYLSKEDSLEITMTNRVDGLLITKKTTFYGNRYISNHYTSTNTDATVGLVWDKVIDVIYINII